MQCRLAPKEGTLWAPAEVAGEGQRRTLPAAFQESALGTRTPVGLRGKTLPTHSSVTLLEAFPRATVARRKLDAVTRRECANLLG